MLRRLVSAAIAGAVLAFSVQAPVWAEDLRAQPKAVVELFTSQGCAQCPPADALLTSLATREDVIALAYHVDYWDYIGWEDTWGQKAFSDRQRAYAKSWGASSVFTPQMVINGSEGVVGSRRDDVHGAVASAQLPLPVDVETHGDMLRVVIPADASLSNANIWLVRYLDRAEVSIGSGENAGKSMVYTQVVTDRQMLGLWEASTGGTIKLPLTELSQTAQGPGGIAILVQQERNGLPGPILGAGFHRL
ncbi:MAG: DUF1223 domain-containing protein [Phyllobacteriaceae bacterium]|nr:DUF1223 domain-containing protein [Phyllobacteriaceae bacterium]